MKERAETPERVERGLVVRGCQGNRKMDRDHVPTSSKKGGYRWKLDGRAVRLDTCASQKKSERHEGLNHPTKTRVLGIRSPTHFTFVRSTSLGRRGLRNVGRCIPQS